MASHLTARRLFERLRQRLDLHWLGGEGGGDRPIERISFSEREVAPVGYLNPIRPNQIQVVGRAEMAYLHRLSEAGREEALADLFTSRTAAIIIADHQDPPQRFLELAGASDTPLWETSHSGGELISHFQYFLQLELAEKLTLHGVFMEVMGMGVLITGEANIGKSELALELITRGHRLVADDAPEFARIAPDIVQGSCPEVLQDYLEVRGLGLLDIRAMFGDSAIKQGKYLRLIIKLVKLEGHRADHTERITGALRNRPVLGVEIPEVTLPVGPGRNLAVLVETATRKHIMRLKGHDAAEAFTRRQQKAIHEESL